MPSVLTSKKVMTELLKLQYKNIIFASHRINGLVAFLPSAAVGCERKVQLFFQGATSAGVE